MGLSFFLLPQVVAGVLVQDEEWEIRSIEEIRAAAALLAQQEPTVELRFVLDSSTPTSTELKPFLGAVKATGYERKLRLNPVQSLENKIPCDEEVQQIKEAK